MSVDMFGSANEVAEDELDDLQKLIRRLEAERPGLREGREDLQALHEILDQLVRLRKDAELSQKDVAIKMGVKQPTISQFENESSDPKVSTIQRYARAVGTRLRMTVAPASPWSLAGTLPYEGKQLNVFAKSAVGVLFTEGDSYYPSDHIGCQSDLAVDVLHHIHGCSAADEVAALSKGAADESRADFALGA